MNATWLLLYPFPGCLPLAVISSLITAAGQLREWIWPPGRRPPERGGGCGDGRNQPQRPRGTAPATPQRQHQEGST